MPLLIDLVIVMTVIESAALAIYHHRTGRGLAPQEFVPTLAAGLALMLAVRAGVTGAGWGVVAAGLAVAGLAHVADVRRRWRG
jgi:hypothetical protein